jgi:hypothetical protein
MSRFLIWLLALVPLAVLVAVAGALLRERADAGRGMPAFSVYSDDRNGLAEAAHFLRELGWRPLAVTRPIYQTRNRGLLVLAEPEASGPMAAEGGMSADEARGIIGWVEAGNTLLLCSDRDGAVQEALGITVTSDGRPNGGTLITVNPQEAGGISADVDRLGVHDGTTLIAPGGLSLWLVRDRVGAALIRRGAGRVLVVADPTILTRSGLLREDNALFLANVADRSARDGVIYFDEYHHGFRSAGGAWGYLAYRGQQILFVLLLLAAGAAAWSAGVRLGPAVPKPPSDGADAVEYASALALLYRRAGVRRLPARTLARGFVGDLTRHLRLRRNALPAEILAAWRRQGSETSTDRLQQLLRGVGQLRKGDVSGRQLLSFSREFDDFKDRWLTTSHRKSPL